MLATQSLFPPSLTPCHRLLKGNHIRPESEMPTYMNCDGMHVCTKARSRHEHPLRIRLSECLHVAEKGSPSPAAAGERTAGAAAVTTRPSSFDLHRMQC